MFCLQEGEIHFLFSVSTPKQTVVNKLFEFMHETFPGVQDMACDTFLKISKQCKEKFVITHQGEVGFIEDILANLNLIIRDLDSSQV